VDYFLTAYGLVRFRDRIYVLDISELNKVILREFHVKPYSGHPGYQKSMTVVNKFYYWSKLKRDVVEFVARCFDCQCVEVECKHLGRLLKLTSIPKWKWEVISMDLIIGFPRTVRQHESIMVIVDRLTKVSHFILVKFTFSSSDVA